LIPIISIVGKTDCGKTTLIEKLVPELVKRGYRVGTIKHDVHGFDIDLPGKDSWRHSQAGATTVIISSPDKLALVKKVAKDHTLDELAASYFSDVDIILTEGYKKEAKPKIEILRSGVSDSLLSSHDELLFIATDRPGNFADSPSYHLDDVSGMADLIEKKFLSEKKPQIQLVIDGQEVSLNEFAQLIITNTTLGMVSSLKGIKQPKEIVLKIHKK